MMRRLTKKTNMRQSHNGFTMVEVSIVLLIISFLFFSVSYGSNIIKEMRLKSVYLDLMKYNNAVNTFKEIYKALPGDYKNASTSFGCSSCDGDGDGVIENANGTLLPVEDLLAWRHLSLAELIEGEYSGTASGIGRYSTDPNSPNAPFSIYKSGLFTFKEESDIYDTSGLRIGVGLLGGGTENTATDDYISNNDARAIELKFDDDSPYTGDMYVIRGDTATLAGSGCVSASSVSSPPIMFSTMSDVENCVLIFWLNKYN